MPELDFQEAWDEMLADYRNDYLITKDTIEKMIERTGQVHLDPASECLAEGLDSVTQDNPLAAESFQNLLEMIIILCNGSEAVQQQIDGRIQEQECARKVLLVSHRSWMKDPIPGDISQPIQKDFESLTNGLRERIRSTQTGIAYLQQQLPSKNLN